MAQDTPLVKEADPELERLLAEEDDINRAQFTVADVHHERHNGYLRGYEAACKDVEVRATRVLNFVLDDSNDLPVDRNTRFRLVKEIIKIIPESSR